MIGLLTALLVLVASPALAAGNRRRGWVSRAFPGAKHCERAWAARVDIPLTFLLGN